MKRMLLRLIVGAFFVYVFTYPLSADLKKVYESQPSIIVSDRHGKEILIKPNNKGYYARFTKNIPPRFKELLLKKEDHFFYYHLGVNPISILRDALHYLFTRRLLGSSTITQQLVKNLLGNENKRNLPNKIQESVSAIALELHESKDQILTMYTNTAYFGNQAQGIMEASYTYFDLSPEGLSDRQILELLATLNSPSLRYPGTYRNHQMALLLAHTLGISFEKDDLKNVRQKTIDTYATERKSTAAFELSSFLDDCRKDCKFTIDKDLTEKLREILARNLQSPSLISVKNGAIVVIKLGASSESNEVLAIVGSPLPTGSEAGYQINMALEPRPIGSTGKPFFYLKAFEKGVRPYTLVEDREYKYTIGTGFPFYPKNYDGEYRGIVSLHEALANSLNVPSVKVLEYLGLQEFYDFIRKDLGFKPIQPLEEYALGIAMGGLEMDLLTLAHYYTIFPNEGVLKPLTISPHISFAPPKSEAIKDKRLIVHKKYVQLVNKILSDREAAADQFGLKTNLNLPHASYAVKTGTSRDFHDSWTIGYTPDFLVGVWLGNSDNTPMQRVSGQTGAGKIWHEAMMLLLNSTYNKNAPFHFEQIQEFQNSLTIEYGLPEDDFEETRYLIQKEIAKTLVLNPHDGDRYTLEEGTRIPLIARIPVSWFIKDTFIGYAQELRWRPSNSGTYQITARTDTGEAETVTIVMQADL